MRNHRRPTAPHEPGESPTLPDGGYRRSDDRACGSYRWQKSTSGAWPRARAGDEPAQAAWSSPLPHEGRRAKERRKPDHGGKAGIRWRARVRDSTRKRGVERALVDGRRPDAARSGLFDETPRSATPERELAFRCDAHAHKGVRGRPALLSRGRQRRTTRGAARGYLDRVTHQDRAAPAKPNHPVERQLNQPSVMPDFFRSS